MSAEVETMFYTRVAPWHGLGTCVENAPGSQEALKVAGLDWKVVQKPIFTEEGQLVGGFKANIRDRDKQILGVVTDCYKVVQNEEAFAFWVRASPMKLQDLCREAEEHGYWQSCHSVILSAGTRSRHILYS